jgi:hypothetical protein
VSSRGVEKIVTVTATGTEATKTVSTSMELSVVCAQKGTPLGDYVGLGAQPYPGGNPHAGNTVDCP